MVPAISFVSYNENDIYYAKNIWQAIEDFADFPLEHVTCWCYSKWKFGEHVQANVV